ncbi:MAG: hypothetical protein OK457_00560 [Thaumarchaeota archaeon]|nr:hypothetical protein [Nitrososphaerota archaeon]
MRPRLHFRPQASEGGVEFIGALDDFRGYSTGKIPLLPQLAQAHLILHRLAPF